MKKYKLKKDLPTFKAGDIFELRGDGCLYLWSACEGCKHWKATVMAYHKNTLERFPTILKEWFEEIKDEPWKPIVDVDTYYTIEFGNEVDAHLWVCHEIDKAYMETGNCFQTEEQAEKAVEWLKAFKVLRDDTKGFKPDWGDEEAQKWMVLYDHHDKRLEVSGWTSVQRQIIYFATEADAEESIKNHRQEWLTFFGVAND